MSCFNLPGFWSGRSRYGGHGERRGDGVSCSALIFPGLGFLAAFCTNETVLQSLSNNQWFAILAVEVEDCARCPPTAEEDKFSNVTASIRNLGEDDRHWRRLICIGDRESGKQKVAARIR
jgi:hypothetical protein